jgi:hypothetical protein
MHSSPSAINCRCLRLDRRLEKVEDLDQRTFSVPNVSSADLALKSEVSRDWIYGRPASGVIDSAYVLRHSEGEGMLIKHDPG